MRKALSSILVLILLLGMVIPASAAGTPTLSISSGEVKAGESVTLTVSIENNPGIAALMLYVYYDTDVFSADPNNDVQTTGIIRNEGILVSNVIEEVRKGYFYDGDKNKNGMASIWMNLDDSDVSKDGALLSISLTALKDAQNGQHAITLGISQKNTYNNAEKPVDFILSEGIVNVSGGSDKGKSDNKQAYVSGSERLRDTLVLRINSFSAVSYGALKAIDNDNHSVTPVIDDNDRTLVPIRFVAESLGANVSWDDVKRQVTISLNGKNVVMTIGSTSYTIDGTSKTMDTAPVIFSNWGRTMVPIRFVAEALGMAVEWDAANRLVFITPSDSPWNVDGDVEKEAVSEVFQLMMLQPFL